MPIRHAIWRVSANPEQLVSSQLANEQLLEEMIAKKPEILHPDWMLIGRQVNTAAGGRIDLLAIQPDGSLVIIELKRNRTPRDVVAQAIDYASWVDRLRSEEIASIYTQFKMGQSLSADFKDRFRQELDEENLNQSHQIVVVAAALDDSTERIISYLNERDIAINALFFQIFSLGEQQLLSRAWLLDPASTQVKSTTAPDDVKEPWNGEFYASFGHGPTRSWHEAVTYGFISAGGGSWYSNTLKLLQPNDLIWVKAPGHGFVGVGRVMGTSEPASSFKVKTTDGETPVLLVVTEGNYHREFENDPEKSEYFVPVRWLQTVPITQAVNEIGLFGNQNTVCKPTTPKWRYTVDRLKTQFPNWNT
jgi:Endonuclease NucS C-terminal domain